MDWERAAGFYGLGLEGDMNRSWWRYYYGVRRFLGGVLGGIFGYVVEVLRRVFGGG